MSMPNSRQRRLLTRELTSFVREQSPMFTEELIDSAKTVQYYTVFDRTPDDIELPGQLEREETTIELGMLATRHAGDKGARPWLTFDIWLTATRSIHPRQLELPDDEWERLGTQYDDAEATAFVNDDDVVEDVTPLGEAEIRDDIIEAITDEGDAVDVYQTIGYSFSTAQPAIETSYERGIRIEDSNYDVHSTHDASQYDEEWEFVQPIGDNLMQIPPKRHEDELSIVEEYEVRRDFLDIIRGVHLDREANMNELIPHEDKLAELRHLVQCMRRKRIDLT